MRFSKRTAAVAAGVAVLMSIGASGAMAAGNNNDGPGNSGDHKVTICHHTGSTNHRYVTITVDKHAVPAHLAHGDTLGPCSPPNPNQPPPDQNPPPDHGCSSMNSSDDETSDQSGLVNVASISADNLGSNVLCQSNLLNGLTVGVLGDAFGGYSTGAAGGDGCSSDNLAVNNTNDQFGLVNVGNISVDNLASNGLCQANIANNPTAAVLGTALGGDDAMAGNLLDGFLGLGTPNVGVLAHLSAIF